MPVMVTGTDNPIGYHAVRLLAGRGGEVRVFVQTGDDGIAPAADPPGGASTIQTYRGWGCKVAVGFLDDEAHVETALEQVHTVLHLLGRPTDDPAVYLERTATVIGAAIGAGCRRLVLASDLAADQPGDNPWLRALAEAEDMAADAPLESVVLRCAVVHEARDPLTTALAAGGLGPDPDGSHWPVAATDVAMTAVLADAERNIDTRLHVVVPLTGPERMSTAAYVEALAQHLPAAPGDDLPPEARELMARTIDRPPDALGLGGRRLADGP